jgi:hypothetical protein
MQRLQLLLLLLPLVLPNVLLAHPRPCSRLRARL